VLASNDDVQCDVVSVDSGIKGRLAGEDDDEPTGTSSDVKTGADSKPKDDDDDDEPDNDDDENIE
jgi:hypothetical protein